MAAFSSDKTRRESERVPFYLYIDEFQNFASRKFYRDIIRSQEIQIFAGLGHQKSCQSAP